MRSALIRYDHNLPFHSDHDSDGLQKSFHMCGGLAKGKVRANLLGCGPCLIGKCHPIFTLIGLTGVMESTLYHPRRNGKD